MKNNRYAYAEKIHSNPKQKPKPKWYIIYDLFCHILTVGLTMRIRSWYDMLNFGVISAKKKTGQVNSYNNYNRLTRLTVIINVLMCIYNVINGNSKLHFRPYIWLLALSSAVFFNGFGSRKSIYLRVSTETMKFELSSFVYFFNSLIKKK